MNANAVMKLIVLRYTLRNGSKGTLYTIAASTGAAIVAALDIFGEALRSCTARCA